MKKYSLLFIIFPLSLFSQNNGDNLKFEIIKAAVNFYATDSISYKSLKGKSLSCEKPDYSCISDFCKKNDVQSIQKKVDEWQKLPSSSAEDVRNLSVKIIADISSKEHRKKFDSYKKFTETANQLAASLSDAKPQETTPVQENTDDAEPNPTVNESEPATEAKSESNLPIYALITAIIALLLSIANFFRGKGGSSQKSQADYDLISVKEDIKQLNNRVSQKQNVDLRPIEEKLRSLENKISNFENQPRTVEFNIEKKIETSTQSNSPVPSSKIVYAKIPDTGNGFSQSILAQNQNGEQIYEIEIKGDKATFSISEDANAQKYALSDFNYYLSSACDFQNQPVKNCRIHTSGEGTLSKSGNNWVIQSKAKIEFK